MATPKKTAFKAERSFNLEDAKSAACLKTLALKDQFPYPEY
jgi:hypothetical protein